MPVPSDILEAVGSIRSLWSETIDSGEAFIETAARFAADPGTVVLMSGGNLDCARYHVLAVDPWLKLSCRGQDGTVMKDRISHPVCGDPLDLLSGVHEALYLPQERRPVDRDGTPVRAGLFGYLAYDLKDHLEALPRTSVDDLGLPHLCFYAPSAVLVHDKFENRTRLHMPIRSGETKSSVISAAGRFKQRLADPAPPAGGYSGDPRGFSSGFRRRDYLAALERIHDYISAGHVYQVNMSQRFSMGFSGEPFALFRSLYEKNPAPFFAYVNAGDHQIVSTSPERFVQQNGRRVETRPIKGTRPRGKTPAEDDRLKNELARSVKDDAELSMIVDLLRNDLGKVCEAGSVKVAEHKRLEAYENVHHLVSVVDGRLDSGKTPVDVIRATFPGGSITGCPKIRAMEIIDELEPVRRHIYTGSIGYISVHDTMDLSIAIRTATVLNDKIVFSVGGGIVYDSDPADEYQETLHKGKTLMSVFERADPASPAEQFVWQDGILKPVAGAVLPAADEGLQYGNGFFETIRIDRGFAHLLAPHLARFDAAWRRLFPGEPPDVTWTDVIERVIQANRLEEKTAAVKILATRGTRALPPYDGSLIVSARPYTHRLAQKKRPGLELLTYPHPRQTPLADLKTLNYLYYLDAGRWALSQGADEALILNPDGSVSETNSANILIVAGQRIVRPLSEHVLPGVMEKAVCDVLSAWGYAVANEPCLTADLARADAVMLTNSLMGAVPVGKIDGAPLLPAVELCDRINRHVDAEAD